MRLQNFASLLGRALIAAFFLAGAWDDVTHSGGLMAALVRQRIPLPHVSYYLVIAVELVGGAALLAGFRAKWAGITLAALAFGTAMLGHYRPLDHAQMVLFWQHAAIAGGALLVAAWGAGRWSGDRK